jgi:putative transposase
VYAALVPWGLKRYQQARDLHFITFSCYRRQPRLASALAKRLFEQALEQARRQYGFYITGYVVMPEHVHLLVSEPEHSSLARAVQAMKQSVARKLIGAREHFWQARYYDFNVWTKRKRVEKLRYMNRNPVKRGLVEKPENWPWSSFRHYLTGAEGVVEIESEWTGRRRERMGMPLRVKVTELPHPSTRMSSPNTCFTVCLDTSFTVFGG